MPFQKVESPSKSLLVVASRSLCWFQRQLCNLSSDQSVERTSEGGVACSRSTSSLDDVTQANKISLIPSMALLLISVALGWGSLCGNHRGEGALQPGYPSGLLAAVPARGSFPFLHLRSSYKSLRISLFLKYYILDQLYFNCSVV